MNQELKRWESCSHGVSLWAECLRRSLSKVSFLGYHSQVMLSGYFVSSGVIVHLS